MNRNLKRIEYNNLIQFFDEAETSERDREIIKMGLSGKSTAEIARYFNLSSSRIAHIYWQFCLHCGELHGVIYKEDSPPEASKIYFEAREHKAELKRKKEKKK